ncbi:DNA-directed RNA polymerase I core subunit rpa12 [Basidiobolus ranarum]|uniref:DNA-directed RNA polymerase I core subunit rpa12 n=1 Tax=Basidiobolus ranarum TaxID=34480 RepID=A0ABR2WD51_9FUNG
MHPTDGINATPDANATLVILHSLSSGASLNITTFISSGPISLNILNTSLFFGNTSKFDSFNVFAILANISRFFSKNSSHPLIIMNLTPTPIPPQTSPKKDLSVEDTYTKLYVQQLIDNNQTDVLVQLGIISNSETNKPLPYILNSIKKFFDTNKPEQPTPDQNNATCKYCGHNNVLVREYQLRSADEGSNLVHECMNCHKSWTV